MEIIHNGRKIVSAARRIGTSWLLETAIWPPTSDGAEDPQLIQTIGAASESVKRKPIPKRSRLDSN